MNLIVDKQSLEDLNIFAKRGQRSVYDIFNHTRTKGGADLLEEMFRSPFADLRSIQERSDTVEFIKAQKFDFPILPSEVDAAANYLEITDQRSQLLSENNSMSSRLLGVVVSDLQQTTIINGINAMVGILHQLNHFFDKLSANQNCTGFSGIFKDFETSIKGQYWEQALSVEHNAKISFQKLTDLDKLFRFSNMDAIAQLFNFIYLLDVYITVANVAQERNFTTAIPIEKGLNAVDLTGLFHPFVSNAVPNTVSVDQGNNILFLTGANMAGKSTFMKSVGVALYLAHMGFPVPAQKMVFSVYDAIMTTINLADSLNLGYSHFFGEVLRMKKMSELVSQGKDIFLIVDELFRGTNVKDAYDATVAITSALANRSNCAFLVSTHVMEAGEVLKDAHSNIKFIYLPTSLDAGEPVYTYRLEPGISDDRHGMILLQNEGILEILNNGKKVI